MIVCVKKRMEDSGASLLNQTYHKAVVITPPAVPPAEKRNCKNIQS